MKNARSERRLYPRIEQCLPLKVAANGYDFVTSTQNISCLGAYCHINKYVPPFTKVMIRLNLPMMNNNGHKDSRVECKGVIVRTEDEKDGGFNVAVYFNEIKDDQRKKISQYINQFLPQKTSV
jgi:c-di-GMP-binding flagellar brake protein YcgR